MGLNFKTRLIGKVLPPDVSRNSISNNLNNVYVLYKHQEDNFNVTLSKNAYTPKDTSNVQVQITRDTFIKNILENIKLFKPSINSENKRIIIDYSSPNIAKPFHVGHLRSTIIGNFIGNLHTYLNNKVTKINYLGDWGTQFGLLQYGLKANNINIDDLKQDPMTKLYNAYVYANKLSSSNEEIHNEARKFFALIEQGRADLESWKQIRQVTVNYLKTVYQRLAIEFDTYHWESDYNYPSIKHLMSYLEEKKIIVTDKTGKKVARVNGRDVTVLKSDNSTLYISRDIAALLDRYKNHKFDEMLYVVDNAQTDHFAALFSIVQQIDNKCTEGCKHIKFGRIKGMSTRSGNVVFLNDILDEAKEKMYEKQQKSKNTRSSAMNETTCDTLGATAVIINDLKQKRLKDYAFQWDKALQSEGDSGIKLQYLHCRLWNIEKNNNNIPIPDYCDPKYLPEEVVGDIVAELVKFEDVLYRSFVEYEACILVNYLFRLARHVNRMFNELNVKNADPDLAAQRLLVFHSARTVVRKSLEILGVKPLYEM